MSLSIVGITPAESPREGGYVRLTLRTGFGFGWSGVTVTPIADVLARVGVALQDSGLGTPVGPGSVVNSQGLAGLLDVRVRARGSQTPVSAWIDTIESATGTGELAVFAVVDAAAVSAAARGAATVKAEQQAEADTLPSRVREATSDVAAGAASVARITGGWLAVIAVALLVLVARGGGGTLTWGGKR